MYCFLFLVWQFCLLKDVVSSRQYWSNALHFLDYKLIFIPAVFVLLRMWTCINSFLFVYLNVDVGSFPKWLGLVLILLSVSTRARAHTHTHTHTHRERESKIALKYFVFGHCPL